MSFFKNRSSKFIFIILFIAFINNYTFVNSQISIYGIQSLDGLTKGQISGSIQGGTRIRIKGAGFSNIAAENHVFIGSYPCNLLSDGSTQTILNCQTTYAYNSAQTYQLGVTVKVEGTPKNAMCTNSQCRFTYTSSQTPLIQQINPRTASGDQQISIWGIHRITDTGDQRSNGAGQIYNILIDKTVCSTIDVIQGDQLLASERDTIKCVVFKDQQAGQYSFKQHVKPGIATMDYRTQQTSFFTLKNYTQRVVGKIANMPYHSGGTFGHNIQLKGSGFSLDENKYKCQVAGQQCKISNPKLTSLTVEIPSYNSTSNINYGALTKQSDDISAQINNFLGSNGWRYTRYNYIDDKNSSEWLTYLRGTHSLTVQEDKIKTQLSSTQFSQYKYVEYWRGYFFAPKDGQYRFAGLADDGFVLQMSSVQNNANLQNLQTLISSQEWSGHHFNPYYTGLDTQISNVTLKQGYYYMQAINWNSQGKGYFKIMVDMPQFTNYTINPTWQVDTYIIAPASVTAQVIEIKVHKNISSYKLSYNIKQGTSVYIYNSYHSKGQSIKNFKSNLQSLPYYRWDYSPIITMKTIDLQGLQTNITANIQHYVYTLRYQKYRNPLSNMQRTLYSNFAVIKNISNHSAPISGTYKISLNGQDLKIYSYSTSSFSQVNIPYTTPAWQIRQALNKFYNTTRIQVATMKFHDSDDSIQMTIQYIALLGKPFEISINTSLLLGGNDNQFNVNYNLKRQFSAQRPFYSPLPYDFMRTSESKSQLYITLNNLPILCQNCVYQYNSALNPTLNSVSLSGKTLSFSLTDSASVGFTSVDLSVHLNQAQCLNVQGSLNSLTCSFNNNSLNQAQLSAGNQKPSVHIASVGFADTSAVNSINVNLIITSIAPSVTGTNGGVEGKLIGSGFPLNMNDGSLYSLYLCGNKVTKFISVSNEIITFIIPKGINTCNSSNSILSVNNINQTITGFSYDPNLVPVINSLSIHSSSPILKSTIQITGNLFSDINHTKVYLVKTNQSQPVILNYELTIIEMNNTYIKCILGGGKTGEYDVVVADQYNGQSNPSVDTKFYYEIIVELITPKIGSLGGGYDITIKGKNFAQSSSHTVFIGQAQNTVCQIKSSNSTHIICTVPRIDDSYTENQQQKVVVTGRLLQESLCKGQCGFTYLTTLTNFVNIPTYSAYLRGMNVTITGSDLTGSVVKVGSVTVNLTQSNSTSLTFVYPALKYGEYQIKILTPSGYTHPKILSTTTLKINSALSYSSGSLNGHRISVNTYGFPQKVDKYLSVKIICMNYTVNLPIISVSPKKIIFETVKSEVEQACTINITYETTYKTYTYYYKSVETPSSSISLNATNTYTITVSNSTFIVDMAQFQYLTSQSIPTRSIYPANVIKISNTTYNIQPTGSYLPNGKFKINIHSTDLGYHTILSPLNNVFIKDWSLTPTFSPIQSSFIGKRNMKLTGSGFITNNIENNQVTVCGLKSKIVATSTTQLTFQIPSLVTTVTQNLYNLTKPQNIQKLALLISDNPSKASNIVDDIPSTIYTSSNQQCYIGFNFGINTKVDIQYIKYMPNPSWGQVAKYLQNSKFQGSNDGSTWTQIFKINTNQVHSGWNYWTEPIGSNSIMYQYVRFSHNNQSNCQLSDIQINGIVYSTLSVTNTDDKSCNIIIKGGNSDVILTNAVVYKHNKTSTVTKVQPLFGSSLGGTVLTINGTNFGANVTVKIDEIPCINLTNTATSITCTTGLRALIPSSNSFIVTSDQNPVLTNTQVFSYMDRWSQQATWGGQALPRQDDTVYVPKGMTLLVDVPQTPILNSIIVQGRIIFSDQIDMKLDTHYFIINGGQFIAGTETKRYLKKLTITLHGGYNDKQLPIFGNKVLGCRNCKFSLHGKVRIPTWTQLSDTILVGDTQFSVMQAVDWVEGESIVVASSSFDHYQSEERIIKSVSSDKKTITVTQPFKYRHYSAVETYGSIQFPMRAQVALLTRNIKIQGDQNSQKQQYGSHMMMNGKKQNGLVASFSYAQFTKCGQPKIVGRYCTHFHMTGQMPDSSVRGLAVHHSYARVLTIHGTHFLLVQKNVGYHVKGHNIFIQDGIETNNVIQDNLMISSIASLTMLQSDITVASYWVTNPYNTVRRNHAAGSDFYGFWYQIKQHPDGPSATSDICPMGMQIGQSKDNYAHSNVRFGLRIFKLSARKYPCITTKDQSLEDPYSGNEAYHSLFQNYILWKNQECGFLGEQLGYTTIRGFKTVDSKKGGMQFHKTNFTKQLVVAEDCLIVGFSNGNAPSNVDTQYSNSRGFIASRTDGLLAQNISFYNFGNTMTPLQSCSECYHFKLWVVGSKTTQFKNISYNNILGDYIFWQKWRRQIFMDLDGTLLKPVKDSLNLGSSILSPGSITPYRPSVMIPNHCYQINGTKWDHSTYCDSTVQLRSILFTNAIPQINFHSIDIKAYLLSDPYDNFTLIQPVQEQFSQQYMIIIKKSQDIKNSWAMPFAVGQYYNVHWKWGVDFNHIAIAPSRLWNTSEGTVLRFNYTDQRELYQIGKWYKQQLQKPFIVGKTQLITPQTCQNGDFYHDRQNRYVFVCVSGRNKKINQWIDVNGIRCLNFCPTSNVDGQRENFQRYWSDINNWPNGKPKFGQNVTIPYEWNLILDQPVPKFKYVQINGLLIFDATKNHTFQAHYIWVKKGIIRIGTADRPYENYANIILHGQKNDKYLVLDPEASGNKMLAVTGTLQFFGKIIDTTWTKLTSIARVGSTQINVVNSQGWQVGDKIVIAPTYDSPTQYQQVTITQISNNVLKFTPALLYEHYGAASSIQNNYGEIDYRAGVGLLSHNIKISKGPDTNGWGCHVLAHSYDDIPENTAGSVSVVTRTGQILFDGVQLDGCAQYDTTQAGLRFYNLGSIDDNTLKPNIIKRSSIHNCNGMCMWIQKTQNILVDNNVIFKGKKFLIYAQAVNHYTITKNLLVGAQKRPQMQQAMHNTMMVDDVSCYQQYHEIDYDNDNITVTNNLAQGSETGQGFVFPYAPCEKLSTYNFGGNTAGSCRVAFMFHKIKGYSCIGASKLVGYASQIGLMGNPGNGLLTKMIYEDVRFVDNQRGITLRYAHQIDDNTMILRNSYFAGFSRPNCPDCYSTQKLSYCKGGYAIRMFTATISGQSFPLVKKNTGFDVICTQQSYDMKSFIDNVTFENYQFTNKTIPYCSNMAVFKRHQGASDMTASTHLTKSPCINCEPQAWAYFDQPNSGWRGWFGGCGELDCTGSNNYFIYDQDGSFTGVKSQILANNSQIGSKTPNCTYIKAINGHHCVTEQFAALQYQSIAPDFNKRKMWPVYLKYEGGPWNTVTNGWKQWQWDGPQPMNLRLARFVSIIKLHETYNLTYSSQPPADSRFQIQKRLLPTGNQNDWAIIRIYYPLPNSIQILVKNTTGTDIVIKPFPLKQGIATDLKNHTNFCGANNFYYQKGIIQFLVNGKNNCQVRVRLSSFIKLTTRLSIPIADFYSNNGVTTFMTNICAFLGIDTGRLKIVGIRTGSTIIQFNIQNDPLPLNQSTIGTLIANPEKQLTTLTQTSNNLIQGIKNGTINLGGSVMSVSSSVVVINQDGTVYSKQKTQDSKTLIIILATIIPIIIVSIVLAGYCYIRRKRQKVSATAIASSEVFSENGQKTKYQRQTIKVSEVPFQINKMDDISEHH